MALPCSAGDAGDYTKAREKLDPDAVRELVGRSHDAASHAFRPTITPPREGG